MNKLLLTILMVLSCLAMAEDDKMKIRCVYLAESQIEAEQGAITMANSICKEANHINLASVSREAEAGGTYWIAVLIIEVTGEQIKHLHEIIPEPEPESPIPPKDKA